MVSNVAVARLKRGSSLVAYLFPILILYASVKANAQQNFWVGTNGPYGGFVNAFAVLGESLFAGTDGGVFRSTDNGTSWTAVNNGLSLSDRRVSAFAVIGGSVFAATITGVYRSTNNGNSWIKLDPGFSDVITFAVSGTNLFAGTSDRGVFLSTDTGTTWTAANTGLRDAWVSALAVSGTKLFAGTRYRGVFLSTDNGTTWTPVNTGLTDSHVTALVVCGTDLFVATERGGVFISPTNGTSWTPANNGLKDPYVNAFAVSSRNLFAGTNGSGVFLSTNNGADWEETNTGLTAGRLWSLATSGTNLFAGTDNGVYRSTDRGNTWTKVNEFDIASLVVSPTGYIFAGSGGYRFPGIYRSTDNGDTWTHVEKTIWPVFDSAVDSNGYIFAGSAGVYRSTDYGDSWTQIGLAHLILSSLAVNSAGYIFASVEQRGDALYRSTDNGTNWTRLDLPGWPRQLAVNSVGNIFVTSYSESYDGGFHEYHRLYRSTDNGDTWQEITSLTGNKHISALAINSADYIFAGTAGEVYRSTDNGDSWVNVGWVDNLSVSCFAFDPGGYIFAGSYFNGRVYRSINPTIPVPPHQLYQNYPNPFNSSTRISFNIHERSHVKLVVYDILGREVRKPVDEEKDAGKYELEFDAAGLPSGVYFYTLQVGGKNEARKMVLLR